MMNLFEILIISVKYVNNYVKLFLLQNSTGILIYT